MENDVTNLTFPEADLELTQWKDCHGRDSEQTTDELGKAPAPQVFTPAACGQCDHPADSRPVEHGPGAANHSARGKKGGEVGRRRLHPGMG